METRLPSEIATEIVAQRREVYGHPADVYRVWAVLLAPIIRNMVEEMRYTPTAQETAMMLILLKCAREIHNDYPGDYRDNLDDIAGYANVLHVIKERRHAS